MVGANDKIVANYSSTIQWGSFRQFFFRLGSFNFSLEWRKDGPGPLEEDVDGKKSDKACKRWQALEHEFAYKSRLSNVSAGAKWLQPCPG